MQIARIFLFEKKQKQALQPPPPLSLPLPISLRPSLPVLLISVLPVSPSLSLSPSPAFTSSAIYSHLPHLPSSLPLCHLPFSDSSLRSQQCPSLPSFPAPPARSPSSLSLSPPLSFSVRLGLALSCPLSSSHHLRGRSPVLPSSSPRHFAVVI